MNTVAYQQLLEAGEESKKSRIEVDFDMNVLFVLMSLSSNVIARYEAIYL